MFCVVHLYLAHFVVVIMRKRTARQFSRCHLFNMVSILAIHNQTIFVSTSVEFNSKDFELLHVLIQFYKDMSLKGLILVTQFVLLLYISFIAF